jgi:CRISPR-associated endonuclease/helicase Cas3
MVERSVELSVADFAAYFKEVHGAAPFPWQARLLAEVASAGAWPALLDLPTGAGKTAAIDVALFHLALDPSRAPRRVVLVVDRRTVVDQAYERARTIAAALEAARSGVLKVVADRLRALSGTGAPLATAQLRGGMPRDDAWARRPDQPVVAVSTVDQVGSRLLFRGYGVSEAMRPIHAGLLGNDTLVLLDEVHLSQPFRETLAALRGYRAGAPAGLPDRWQVVEMSATAGAATGTPFALHADDRRDARLAQRLGARKPAEVAEVKVSGGEPAKRATFAGACAERAARLAGPGRVVGVVVNRVATARAVSEALRERLGKDARVFLVTGRMRPLDRDDLDEELSSLVRSGRTRDAAATPVVVVSTQCIEAGADFDFDALVTECASLDALRQRFGRLNRLGEIGDARGVVLARSDGVGKDADDPIYGKALAATWEWLGEAARDFGIDALALPEAERLAKLLAPRDRAPVMLPAHLDLWAQTKPTPQPDPDVSLWLHGIDQKQEPEVQVVWRADLSEALLAAAREKGPALEALLARVEVCPPVGLEAIGLPLHAVRAWLTGEAAREVADVEGRSADESKKEEHRGEKPSEGKPALLWRGDESRVIAPAELYPGSTIVVPSTYGGLAGGGWDPAALEAVPDLGDRARWQQTRRPVLRLHPALLEPGWPRVPAPAGDDAETDDRQALDDWLTEASALPAPPWRRAVLAELTRQRRRRALVWLGEVGGEGEGPYPVLMGRVPARGEGSDVTTEDDGASHTGVEVTLQDHMKGVADWAKEFAERCGLPAETVRDLWLSGRWHDAGKVDPRFQRMLHGGSTYKAEVAPEPLAKSALLAGDRAARALARKRSGYPEGARHELASVALLAAHAPLLAEAVDRELVLHLVASHHGWCRPFAPAVTDPEPVDLVLDTGQGLAKTSSAHGLARLDSGVAERFWRLVERYGWYGLAWLEAILRLADHRRSEEEQHLKEAS